MNSPPSKKVKLDGQKASSDSKDHFDAFLKEVHQSRLSAGDDILDVKFNKKRCRMLSKEAEIADNSRGIVYWMSRDQRVQDNWALLFAQRLALKQKLPLHVCFCLVPTFLGATIRHYMFMIKGLQEVEAECKKLQIQFHLLLGQAKERVPEFVKKHNIGGVVTDFCPLRVPMEWVESVKKSLPSNVPFCQVDAHNIVPCWHASDKQEYGARTIRKKIHDKLDDFLTEFPPVIKHPHKVKEDFEAVDWKAAIASLQVDQKVAEITWTSPGTKSGMKTLYEFCEKRMRLFADKRNDPNINALSGMSPFFHYGQVSVQRAILVAKKYKGKNQKSYESFLEEAVIRRELSDNFCFYQKNYDNIDGAYAWAKKTLDDHRKDKREFLYSKRQLEEAKTFDELWNSSQIQLVKEGKIHGFMRMYWAKKILEWTKSPEDALEIAIYLNDRYSIDGRDPNGYVGCMWSICGIHDQGWGERAVFGKIRYMNYAGCKRKFDINSYVARYGGKMVKYTGYEE